MPQSNKQQTPKALELVNETAGEIATNHQSWRAALLDLPLVADLLSRVRTILGALGSLKEKPEALPPWEALKAEGIRLGRRRALFVAAEAVGQMPAKRTADERAILRTNLDTLIKTGNSLQKVRALRALRHIASEECIPSIERGLQDQSNWVQAMALNTLMRLDLKSNRPRAVLWRFLFAAFKGSFWGVFTEETTRIHLLGRGFFGALLKERDIWFLFPLFALLWIFAVVWRVTVPVGVILLILLAIVGFFSFAGSTTIGSNILLGVVTLFYGGMAVFSLVMLAKGLRSFYRKVQLDGAKAFVEPLQFLALFGLGIPLLFGSIALVLYSAYALFVFAWPLLLVLLQNRLVSSVRFYTLADQPTRFRDLNEYMTYLYGVARAHGYSIGTRIRAVQGLNAVAVADAQVIESLQNLAEENLPNRLKDAIYQVVDEAEKRVQRGQRSDAGFRKRPVHNADDLAADRLRPYLIALVLIVLVIGVGWFVTHPQSSSPGRWCGVVLGGLLAVFGVMAAPERLRLCRYGLAVGLGLVGTSVGDWSARQLLASLWTATSCGVLGQLFGLLMCTTDPHDSQTPDEAHPARIHFLEQLFVMMLLLLMAFGATMAVRGVGPATFLQELRKAV